MSAAALVGDLRANGMEIMVTKGSLAWRGPKGIVSPQIRGDLVAHKSEILDLLAREAVADYRRLRSRVEELGDMADVADASDDPARAADLEAEAFELMDGAAGEALMRVLAFPEELVKKAEASIDLVQKEPKAEIPVPQPLEVPPPIMPVPLSPIPDQPEPTRVCYQCGQKAWRKNPSELWICGVCYPDPDTCAQLPAGIPADGRGRLQLRVLEGVSR